MRICNDSNGTQIEFRCFMTESKATQDQKLKHLALIYISKWGEDPHLFRHIELLQKVLTQIENDGRELAENFKKSQAMVAHLEGKSTLDENEYHEYSAATGWIDDAIEEYQAHREVIAESILIAVSRMIETRASAGSNLIAKYSVEYSIYPGRDEIAKISRKLSRLGQQVKSAYWADAVRVGGNYVRHREEWRVFPYEQIVVNGEKFLKRKTASLVSLLDTAQQRNNAQVIVDLGVAAEDFLEHRRELGFKLVKILGLDDTAKLSTSFSDWMNAMTKFVRQEIGIEPR